MAVATHLQVDHWRGWRAPATGPRWTLRAATVAVASGVVFVVGRDGSWPWRTARVIAVSLPQHCCSSRCGA